MEESIVVKVVDGCYAFCRICYEGDSHSLESPCACSGTLQFAHRHCIQTWCNEKGNIVCEICLQNFKPGYTAPPKKAVFLHSIVTTRDGRENEGTESEPESPTYTADCLAAADRSASYCRFVALILTVVLLVKHLLAEGTTGAYPFTLATILTLRATAIILPMYLLLRIITAIHKLITVGHHDQQDLEDHLSTYHNDEDDRLSLV